jgi:hypothetical protein
LKRIGATSLAKVGEVPSAAMAVFEHPSTNTPAARAININFLSLNFVKTRIPPFQELRPKTSDFRL